jgi:signal transduction histidine kinase
VRFPDEIGSLAHSIERMRAQLEALFGELERKERAQREFATNAAHELRTPLAGIVTALELLQTGAKEEPDERDEFLGMIEREADRLTRLTRALLLLARAEAREQAPLSDRVALAPVLRRVADVDAAIGVDCPPDLAVTGDADLVEQALSSVVANAVEHAGDGAVLLRARRAGRRVVVEVADSGAGIAKHEQERVFERFYRGPDKAGGFGLGLAIARQSVRNLGGEIELESEPGGGTTVRLTFEGAEEGGPGGRWNETDPRVQRDA